MKHAAFTKRELGRRFRRSKRQKAHSMDARRKIFEKAGRSAFSGEKRGRRRRLRVRRRWTRIINVI
jgi:hypothetical protein